MHQHFFKILIIAACHSVSKGEESILRATIDNLKAEKSLVRFIMFSSCPQVAKDFNLKNVEITGNFLVYFMTRWMRRHFGLPILDLKKEHFTGSMKEFISCDLVILNSGDILTEVFRRSSYVYLALLMLAKLLHKPVVVYAQTLDLPSSLVRRIFLRVVLNMVDLITFRDEISIFNAEHIGIRRPCIHLTADPAFFLTPKRSGAIENAITKLKRANSDKPLVGICPSSTIFSHTSQNISTSERYRRGIKQLADLVESIRNETEASIILIPHAYSYKPQEDDRVFTRIVWSKLKRKRHVNILNDVYDSKELKFAISKLDLLITFRMHPLIHALSTGVPCISFDYSGKMHQLMKYSHLPDALTMYIDELFVRSKIVYLIKMILDTEGSNRYRLNNGELCKYTERALSNIICLKELIVQKCESQRKF